MATPRIVRLGPRINESEVAEFEREIGYPLPVGYRGFLLACNGGEPIPNVIGTPSFPGSAESTVRVFYGIRRELRSENILWSYELWVQDSPRQLLPIACDDGDSQFCLSLDGDDAGEMYYWDYYREIHQVQTRYPWTYWVADTFDTFLCSLRPLEKD